MDRRAEEILDYWLGTVGPDGWYTMDATRDEEIRTRYGALWEEAATGALDGWSTQPRPCLALVIVLDQFPRNMFRGSPRAFSSDARALAVAKQAIARGFDERIGLPERLFFYMPLTHSEVLADQQRCVRLTALSFGAGLYLDHARAHREIIRRYGRFPFRNDALGRATTPQERDFLDRGGYQAVVAEMAA